MREDDQRREKIWSQRRKEVAQRSESKATEALGENGGSKVEE